MRSVYESEEGRARLSLTHACALLPFALFVLLALPACRRAPPRPSLPVASRAPELRLMPLAARSWLVDLKVDGFGDAALAVPLGATEPRPIVIALHGAADRPEWACGAFRGVVGPRPFVLCPRGVSRSDFAAPDARYTFGTAATTAAELRAGLAALKQAFGAHVAAGPVVFAGYQIGADHAAAIAREEATFFTRLVLVEPAPDTWPPAQAALFGRQGGERVLFASGAPLRAALALRAVLTRRGGAEAKALVLGAGPSLLDARTVAELAAEWPWLGAALAPRPAAQYLAGNSVTADGPVSAPHR